MITAGVDPRRNSGNSVREAGARKRRLVPECRRSDVITAREDDDERRKTPQKRFGFQNYLQLELESGLFAVAANGGGKGRVECLDGYRGCSMDARSDRTAPSPDPTCALACKPLSERHLREPEHAADSCWPAPNVCKLLMRCDTTVPLVRR